MQKITTQFWACRFASEQDFRDFVAEDPMVYAEENEGKDYPISRFAASQGEYWYDHDFMEVGFDASYEDSKKKFHGHSWAENWSEEFDQRVKNNDVSGVNGFIMMIIDQPPGRDPYRQVSNPVSVSGEEFAVVFLGEITHAQ